jgi:hypothetical protein
MASKNLAGKPESFKYNRNAGQFQNTASGQFIDEKELNRLVGVEINRLKARLQGHARALNKKTINIPEFQTRMAETLKRAHLRIAELAIGGRGEMTPAIFGTVGRLLKDEYGYLAGFGRSLKEGMSDAQAINRAGLYANALKITFSKTWIYSSAKAGYDLFLRKMDAGAKHCRSCPLYDTQGKFVTENKIVPIATACECRNGCKCRIIRKRSVLSIGKILGGIAT